MIQIRNLTKTFGVQRALDDVSLSFEGGKTHALLGSSGSGKSTLLRLMMGLAQPDSGTIEINGHRMTRETQRQIAQSIGYVIQDGGLFPHMTAGKNVTLVAETLGWPAPKIQTRVGELLALVELDHGLMNSYPFQLSGGQRQRISLMRALMLNPPLLFLDEPLGALDPIVRATLQAQLKKIFNGLGKTVVIVTHDVGEAAYFGHTVTLFSEGKVVQQGPFEDLIEKPISPFVTEFINAQRPPPQMKILL